MPAIYEHHVFVTEQDIDEQGHANNLEYVRWMQQAAIQHSTVQGWGAQQYQESGFGWVVRTHQISYLNSAFAGDEIVVRTWIAWFRKATSLRRYEIRRVDDDVLLATAETDWAFVRRGDQRPLRIPDTVKDAFEIHSDESG